MCFLYSRRDCGFARRELQFGKAAVQLSEVDLDCELSRPATRGRRWSVRASGPGGELPRRQVHVRGSEPSHEVPTGQSLLRKKDLKLIKQFKALLTHLIRNGRYSFSGAIQGNYEVYKSHRNIQRDIVRFTDLTIMILQICLAVGLLLEATSGNPVVYSQPQVYAHGSVPQKQYVAVPYQGTPVQYQHAPVQYQAAPAQYQAAPSHSLAGQTNYIPVQYQHLQQPQYQSVPVAYAQVEPSAYHSTSDHAQGAHGQQSAGHSSHASGHHGDSAVHSGRASSAHGQHNAGAYHAHGNQGAKSSQQDNYSNVGSYSSDTGSGFEKSYSYDRAMGSHDIGAHNSGQSSDSASQVKQGHHNVGAHSAETREKQELTAERGPTHTVHRDTINPYLRNMATPVVLSNKGTVIPRIWIWIPLTVL
ncbi:hypothetical protein CEXT_27451 [Caerostris extrusa]|uniref:Uncharacterized protein n=1 Tax=Caerostris extrusa TaxID=172846 RepID=A0AAV4SWT2_CAEEX|nr:hypothetical protein CEXT_27451 [Caerostris extrusa]